MSQATDLSFAVFTDDEVANQTLTLLEQEGKVRKAARLVRGSSMPEGSVHIVHNPRQGGYVRVQRSAKVFVVNVRESSKGITGRYKKALRRIPTLVWNLVDADPRYSLN